MAKDNITQIEKLLTLIKQSGLAKVALEVEGIKLEVSRDTEGTGMAPVPAVGMATTAPAPTLAAPNQEAVPEQVVSAAASNHVSIKSPMIGTFYIASDPNSPPFVKIGDMIQKGQTLCIIEAMKLFNEIEAEQEGKVVEISVENGTPVEYDQELFRIEPT